MADISDDIGSHNNILHTCGGAGEGGEAVTMSDEKERKRTNLKFKKGLCLRGSILMTAGPHDTGEDCLEWDFE